MLSISPFNALEVASLISTTKDKKSNSTDLNDTQNEVNRNILSNISKNAVVKFSNSVLLNSNSSICLPSKGNEKANYISEAFNEKPRTNQRNAQNQQQLNDSFAWNGQSQQLSMQFPLSFLPPNRHYNNNLSFNPPLVQSSNLSTKSSNTNGTQSYQVFSDITQYINPEIHK